MEIAKAVEAGGGDGVSLINTILGMAIDIHRRQPVLGLSLIHIFCSRYDATYGY